jgi:hypothetical protein
MIRWVLRTGAALVAVALFWWAMYPSADDAKNLHYVAWKWHLVSMNPHQALSTMSHDKAIPLVIGMNREQLA